MDDIRVENQIQSSYSFGQSIAYIKTVRQSGHIILGGDVLEADGSYTYINWYYQLCSKETASSMSCDYAEEFITNLVDRDKYQYQFVVSTYEECMSRR